MGETPTTTEVALDRESTEAFDVVVVGSSPLVMIEALHLSMQGQRVVLVEKRDRLGGAWYTIPLWEFESVQPGCHYIERCPEGYVFLKQCLRLELELQTVKAVWFDLSEEASKPGLVKRLRKRLLSGRFLSDDLWGMIKAIDRKDAGKFGRAFKRMLTSPDYCYPVGGSRTLIGALRERIEASDIDLRLNANIDAVDLGHAGEPHRVMINGQTVTGNRLVVGRHAFPRLVMNGRSAVDVEPRFLINVVLRIRGKKAIDFDYFEIHRDELINRVHDITTYCEPVMPAGELMVCCNLTTDYERDARIDTDAVFERFNAWGLLEPGAELLGAHVEQYPDAISAETEPTVGVTIVNTYDLGVGLQRNADRWWQSFQD